MKTKTSKRVIILTFSCVLILLAFYIKQLPNGFYEYSIASAQNNGTLSETNNGPQAETKTILNNLCVINNFGKDPETEHNFTWHTGTAIESGTIDYCAKADFNGFDKNNIIKVPAKSYQTKTDLDTRNIFKVELNNLKPGTEYVYRIDVGSSSVSPQGTFQTAEQNLKKFTFINITDTQGGSEKDYALFKNILDKALQKFPDTRFLVHTGDMVDNGQNISQWELFEGAVKDELMNLDIEPIVGNHEAINRNLTNIDMKNFTDSFDLPKEEDTGAPVGTVYSFDYGNAHIAVMNTECGNRNLSKQADWLVKDMKKTNKLWKIVALHRGPYGATYNTTDIRKAWAPVFDELGIDLVLEGHEHNYMRSYPIKNNAKSEKGTIYLVSNSGGVKLYPQKSRWWQAVDLQPRIQMYTAITIDNNKLITNSYDIKGNLKDSITIEK